MTAEVTTAAATIVAREDNYYVTLT
jgi:hypothetical protein